MAITLTPSAIQQLLRIKDGKVELYLRIGVKGGGCSGLSYVMEFTNVTTENDKVFEFDGIKILVDKKSYLFLNGTEIDYVQELMKSGFEFKNPAAKRTCSCGESFTI